MMQYIQGNNRDQICLFPQSLDQIVDADNEVRVIDLFVETIRLSDYEFLMKTSVEGRPAYHPKDLLKLFIYGYLNHIRSSRQLERECNRNIELMWLLKGLVPDHNTISNFRRDNEKAIRKVFRHTVSIARMFDLIGGKLLAGDSTKLRAQNSRKNNFNEKKIEYHLQYIESRLDEYTKALETADEENKKVLEQKIQTQNDRKQEYETLQQSLKEGEELQISTSDPDSRKLMIRNNICEVAYSVQTVVDEKHNLPIDYKVTNETDANAMSGMLRRAKKIVGHSSFTALYDKGYHTGSEIKKAVEMGVEIMVAVPGPGAFAPDENYNADKFIYNETTDTYTCPQQQVLSTNNRTYTKNTTQHSYQTKKYSSPHCKNCPARTLCTRSERGRILERTEYQSFIEINKQNIARNPDLYKKRQSMVEHPYGTIKRQWGFDHVMTKTGIKRASADVGIIFIAYNLRRLINIIGKIELMGYLKRVASLIFSFLILLHFRKRGAGYYFVNNPFLFSVIPARIGAEKMDFYRNG